MSQTGAQATASPATAGAQVTTAVLEDMLYEMLAVGLDPCEKRVTQKDIQQFLFEHARSPKSREEFLQFFQAHDLPTDPESEARPLALSPVRAGVDEAMLQAPVIQRRPRLDPGPGAVGPDGGTELPGLLPEFRPPFEPAPSAPEKKPGRGLYLACGAAAAFLLLLGALAAIGYTNLVSLKEELEQTRAAQARDRQAVERVDEQISTLGSRTADTGNMLADMEYKLDRVVEVVAPEPEPEPGQ